MSAEWKRRLQAHAAYLTEAAWPAGKPEGYDSLRAQQAAVVMGAAGCETREAAEHFMAHSMEPARLAVVRGVMDGERGPDGHRVGQQVPDPYGREGMVTVAPDIEDGGIDR